MKKIVLLACCLLALTPFFAQTVCDLAIPVQCGTVVLGDSTAGPSNANNANNYGCLFQLYGSGSGGPERIYKLTVTQTATYRFVLDILNGTDLDIIVLRPTQLPCTFNNLNCLGGGFSYEYNPSVGVYREVLDIRLDASTTPYYIFIDGKANPNPGSYVGRFNFTVDCTCRSIEAPNDSPTGEAIFCDDFENYVANKSLEPQSTRWEQRDSTPVDGTVVSDGFLGKGVRFQGTATTTPDEFFLLRDRYSTSVNAGQTTGRYRMSWKTRVEYGKKGYYSVAHQSPVGITGAYNFAYHVNFLETGVGEVRAGSSTGTPIATFPYPQGTWMNVVQIIDIEANKAELWINNNFVYSWAFNIGDGGTSSRLAAINFKAANGYDFKVDEICVWRTITPCNPPPAAAILVENGATYPSEAAARCALYTSLEWSDGVSLCEYGGTFMHRADQYFGTLDISDVAPSLLRTDPCVQAAYGNNVPFPLYADIYIFYKDDEQPVIVNYDNNDNATMRKFVFSCNYRDVNGVCHRAQQCLTETGMNTGVYTPNTCDSFYYIVITSGHAGDNYNLQVVPEGECGGSFTVIDIPCNGANGFTHGYDTLATQVVSDVSRFNAVGPGNAYESCYNGNRTYTGGEKIYRFTLESPALMTFQLNASSPMGMALYSFVCAKECISMNETKGPNNTIEVKQPLFEGTYHLIVDKSVNDNFKSFDLVVNCEKKSFFELQSLLSCERPGETIDPITLGRVPSICLNCLMPGNDPAFRHTVTVNNQNIFSIGDEIHFLFRDSFSHFLSGSPVLSNFWDAPSTLPKNFVLPQNYAGGNNFPGIYTDSLQCSYNNGDSLFIFMTESSNGNHLFRELKPSFIPPGTGAATADNLFAAGQTSVVSNIILGDPVTWYTDLPDIEATNKANTRKIKLHSSLPWVVTEVPDAPWLTLSDVNGLGDGLYDLDMTFTENTTMLPKMTTLRFVSTQRPDVYRLYVPVIQLPPCTLPNVEIVPFNTSFCEGDSIYLRAFVGTEPATGKSLAPLYNFVWKDADGDEAFRGFPPPPSDEFWMKKSTGSYHFSVEVTAKYCDGFDVDDIDFTVTPPPPPPTPILPTSSTICSDDPLPTFKVMNPPPGQIIQWYETATGGSPIAAGTSFVPTQHVSKTYYAGTTFANGLCGSISRIAFTLTVNPLPMVEIADKICTPNHQFYQFNVLTNAGSVSIVGGGAVMGNGGTFPIANIPVGNPITIRVTNNFFCDTLLTISPPLCVCEVETPGFIQNYTFCENTPAPALAVVIAQPNVGVNWYDAPINGTKINAAPANPYTPPAPYLTAYYAEAVDALNGCVSPGRTKVNLTVKPQPSLQLLDTTCTFNNNFYSLMVGTNGADVSANAGDKNFANGVYTFSQISVNQSVTITAIGSNGCTNTLTVNPPNCPCLTVMQPVSLGDKTVCFGDPYPALSVQVGAGQTANWYFNGIPVANGVTQYTPTQPGTYLVETFDPALNCSSAGKTTVKLTVLPEIQYTTTPTVCAYNRQSYSFLVNAGPGRSVTVNGSALSGANGVFASGDIPVGVNAEIVVTDLTTQCHTSGTLPAPACPCVEIINAPGTVAGNSLPVCQAQLKTLTVTVLNPQTANWYNAQNVLVQSGSTVYAPNTQIPGTYTYFAEAYNPVTDCYGSIRTAVTFTVNPAPTVVVSKVCDNQNQYTVTATLTNGNTVSASAGSVSPGPGGTFIVSGIPLGTAVDLTLTNTQTGCASTFNVTSPVNCDCSLLGNINAPMGGANQHACVGQGAFPAVTASVSQANVVVDWYDANGVQLVQASNAYTPAPGLSAGVYTYFAEARNTLTQCVSSTRSPVQLTVSEPPVLLVTTVCEPDFLTYKVQGQTDPGNTVAATVGNYVPLTAGFFEITGIQKGIASTITVTNPATGCQSSETVLLTTCPCPTVNAPISNGDKVMCQGDPTAPTLSVTVTNPGIESVIWFDMPVGGAILGQGLTLQPTVPGATTFYYAEARLQNGFCPSNTREAVRLEVRTRPTANAGVDQSICEGDTLTLSGIVTGVSGGFWAATGGTFIPNNGAFTAEQYVVPFGPTSVTLTLVTDDPAGPCPAASDALELTLLDAPDITIDSVYCSHDLMSYNVLFTCSSTIVNTNLGTPTVLPNHQFRMNNLALTANLSITGFNIASACASSVTVQAPSPCPCPMIAQPVSQLGAVVERCDNESLPPLTVTVASGFTAKWYTEETGGISIQSGLQFTPVLPDDYYVEAVDPVNGCASARTKITVRVKPSPVVFIGPNAAFCPGNAVTLSADAGAGYTYHWSSGQSTQNISVASAGTYFVSVTLSSCTAVDSFVVTQNPSLSVGFQIVDSIQCFGQTGGQLMANLVGGTPPVNAYFWSTQSGLPSITGLSAGTYTVTIVDQAGCSASQSFVMPQPDALTLTNVDVQNTLGGQATGAISFQTNGGTPPYTYQWHTQDSVLMGQTLPMIDSLPIGAYFVVVTDHNGCTINSGLLQVGMVGSSEPGLDGNVQVYPNPTTGQLTVKFTLPNAYNVVIDAIDMLGREVVTGVKPVLIQKGQINLDLSTQPPGLYWLKIKMGDALVVKKVAINR